MKKTKTPAKKAPAAPAQNCPCPAPANTSEDARAEAVRILTEAVERALAVLSGATKNNPFEAKAKCKKVLDGAPLTASQLAERLNLPSRFSIYDLVRQKKIPCFMMGPRRMRFDFERVQAALDKLEVKEAGTPRN